MEEFAYSMAEKVSCLLFYVINDYKLFNHLNILIWFLNNIKLNLGKKHKVFLKLKELLFVYILLLLYIYQTTYI